MPGRASTGGVSVGEDGASAAARRTPAQKAAQQQGLPPGVALHENAMGGWTQSGRKTKPKPADLSKAGRAKAAESARRAAAAQASLDVLARNAGDDELVVVRKKSQGPKMPAPAAREGQAPAPRIAADGTVETSALATLVQGLYRDLARQGSTLDAPSGVSFAVRDEQGPGEVRIRHPLPVPLPGGHATAHRADIVVELEGGATLVLDILNSKAELSHAKALAFDALQLRGVPTCFAVLVFVRVPGRGLTQEQVESIGHGYDHFFGIDEEHVQSELRYAALRSRILRWLAAARRA